MKTLQWKKQKQPKFEDVFPIQTMGDFPASYVGVACQLGSKSVCPSLFFLMNGRVTRPESEKERRYCRVFS